MENKLLDLGFDVAGNNYVFTSPKGYEIIICFTESKYIIDYGKNIKVRHKSTSNLTKPENWVVLECVIRLLNKGYSPSAIELEKTWLLGHDKSGRVDILLKDILGKTYALIECKTWGSEYNKEREKMLEKGSQLFTYFIQERDAKMLYLYSSYIDDGEVKYKTEYVDTKILKGSNFNEVFKSWDGSFIKDGIFSQISGVYDEQYKNLVAPLEPIEF